MGKAAIFIFQPFMKSEHPVIAIVHVTFGVEASPSPDLSVSIAILGYRQTLDHRDGLR